MASDVILFFDGGYVVVDAVFMLNPLFMVVFLVFVRCGREKERAGYFLFVLLLLCGCSCYIVFVFSSRCCVIVCGL